MKKHFYSHLVETESLIVSLDAMDLSEKEKAHILSLIDSSLHHTVLDAILSELSEKDKKEFLEHVVNDDHAKIWHYLNEKVDNIEEKIKKTAADLKQQIHQDILDTAKE